MKSNDLMHEMIVHELRYPGGVPKLCVKPEEMQVRERGWVCV